MDKNITVMADIAKKYKLEVVTPDGFKDYDEIEIKLRPAYIKNISPNPGSNIIDVEYKLNGLTSAYLMIIGTNNISYNYILNVDQDGISIDISSYPLGYYTIALVSGNQIFDAKQLLKQ